MYIKPTVEELISLGWSSDGAMELIRAWGKPENKKIFKLLHRAIKKMRKRREIYKIHFIRKGTR